MTRKPDKRTTWHPPQDEGAVRKAAADLIEKTTRRPGRAGRSPKEEPGAERLRGDALRDETDTFAQLEELARPARGS